MNARPWYKRYPSDFIAGTLELSCEEKGAYSVVIDLMYDKGGPIPDDAQWIARVCNLSTRRWNQIRARLLELGKITVDGDFLKNNRVLSQLKVEEKEHICLSSSGKLGAEKANENRGASKETSSLEEKGPSQKERHTRGQRLEARSQKETKKKEYAYEGKIIRLIKRDFDAWAKAYSNLDLMGQLQAHDDYYDDELAGKERLKWFRRCSASLAKKNQEAKPPPPEQIRYNDGVY